MGLTLQEAAEKAKYVMEKHLKELFGGTLESKIAFLRVSPHVEQLYSGYGVEISLGVMGSEKTFRPKLIILYSKNKGCLGFKVESRELEISGQHTSSTSGYWDEFKKQVMPGLQLKLKEILTN